MNQIWHRAHQWAYVIGNFHTSSINHLLKFIEEGHILLKYLHISKPHFLAGFISKSFRQDNYILCNPMDCSLPGSTVHGILQARILEWVAVSFSRGSFQSRNWTWVSCIASRFFTSWATREASIFWIFFFFFLRIRWNGELSSKFFSLMYGLLYSYHK